MKMFLLRENYLGISDVGGMIKFNLYRPSFYIFMVCTYYLLFIKCLIFQVNASHPSKNYSCDELVPEFLINNGIRYDNN